MLSPLLITLLLEKQNIDAYETLGITPSSPAMHETATVFTKLSKLYRSSWLLFFIFILAFAQLSYGALRDPYKSYWSTDDALDNSEMKLRALWPLLATITSMWIAWVPLSTLAAQNSRVHTLPDSTQPPLELWSNVPSSIDMFRDLEWALPITQLQVQANPSGISNSSLVVRKSSTCTDHFPAPNTKASV